MKFSIITVTYNAGKTLQATLDSIRFQDFSDYELVVVDGLSNDNTLDVIKKNSDLISYFISEKDNGIYDAMNKGIELAKGEFTVFLNAGDVFSARDTLKRVATHIEKSIKNTIYLGYVDYMHGDKACTTYPNLSKLPYQFCHQSMFFRTSVLKMNIYDIRYKLSGDSELLYRLISLGETISIMDVKVAIAEYGEGATYNNLWKSAKELYNIPYLKQNTSVLYRYFRLFKIMVFVILKKYKIII